MNGLLAIIESGREARFDNRLPGRLPRRDPLGHAPSLSSFSCGCSHCERRWEES